MKTKSYHYNQAIKESAERVNVSLGQVKENILNGTKIPVYPPSGAPYCLEIDTSETYNSDCAKKLLEKLGLKVKDSYMDIAGSYIYNTKGQLQDLKIIELYEKMEKEGYMPIHDITEDMHDKKALMSGTITHDWLSSKKSNEEIRLVSENGNIGYRKARMRTRYYSVQIDNDMFIKLV